MFNTTTNYLNIIDTIKNFKNHRNSVANLMKLSKKQHYASFFSENLNNLKNTWKGIKELINIKSNTNIKPNSLHVNNQTLTDESEIADSFNEFFANVAEKLSQKIIPSRKKFTDFLTNHSNKSFYIQPVF